MIIAILLLCGIGYYLQLTTFIKKMATDLVPKPNIVSPIWTHFGFEPDDKGQPVNLDEAICRICSRKVSVSRGNTTNLRSHLRINHPL